MKVNIFYEMASFLNLVAIGGKLRGKKYTFESMNNYFRIKDKESPFEIILSRKSTTKGPLVRINLTSRPSSGGGISREEVYKGPTIVEEKEWVDVLMRVRGKCICGVIMEIELLTRNFLSNITLNEDQHISMKTYPLVTDVNFFGEGWGEMTNPGKTLFKKFVESPERFYVARFDKGTVVIEKTFNPDSLGSLGKEIESSNIKDIDSEVYPEVWTLPLHLIVLNSKMRNLFPGSFNTYLLDTMELSGRFPMSPLTDLRDQIPLPLYKELAYNNVKEVEGIWWMKEEQEGILITDLKYLLEPLP